MIIPDLVQYLRDHGITNVGSPGQPFVGTLSADGCSCGRLSDYPPCSLFSDNIFLGVRTSTPGAGGHYGVYYQRSTLGGFHLLTTPGCTISNRMPITGPMSPWSTREKMVTDRTHFELIFLTAVTGIRSIRLMALRVGAHQWTQIGSILAQSGLHTSQGYAHVIQTSGSNPFITYAVINDGGQPGKGTGDGAFVASSKGNDEISLEIDSEFTASCNIIPWSLKITHAPPNTPIRLVGDPPGLGYSGVPAGLVIPQGATTDAQGNFSTTGTAPWSYIFSVAAYVGNLRSNRVSLTLGNLICQD